METNTIYFITGVLFVFVTSINILYYVIVSKRKRAELEKKKEEEKLIKQNKIKEEKKEKEKRKHYLFEDFDPNTLPNLKILYGTQSGTAERFAKELAKQADVKNYPDATVEDLDNYTPDEIVNEELVVLVVATYIEGAPTNSAKLFYNHLKDESVAPRAGNLLRDVQYGVLGLCNSLYKETNHYNTVGKNLNRWMRTCGAKRIIKMGIADENEDQDKAFQQWSDMFWQNLCVSLSRKDTNVEILKETEKEPLFDIEDLGGMSKDLIKKQKRDIMKKKRKERKEKLRRAQELEDEEEEEEEDNYDPNINPKEMLSSTHKATLTKQGYKIIGSHSAVKLCRWTKSQMRGRGGCYKHTFYGIQSYGCMEATPSMACANKCVFCWRHHKNPVGKSWRWKMDDAKLIVDQAIKRHKQMIKSLRGIPDIKKDRFEDAFNVRHCALSLVGEPIIYPEINQFLKLLHAENISSFLVTNAQFPEAIETLVPCTQLYVSIDAATPETLKEIDRPLFTDFWQRFLDSLKALSDKGQRTVYRLTLVKDYNMEELENYAELVKIGHPDFIEVKGVTFSGGGKKNMLTMKNVPWHEEVIAFCSDLVKCLNKHIDPTIATYEIASEHEHSCCVLIANANKFKIDNTWHTWIDFDKFIELQKDDDASFTSLDYIKPTPEWANYGNEARGFDPVETRFRRNKKKKSETNNNNNEQEKNIVTEDEEEEEETNYAGGGC